MYLGKASRANGCGGYFQIEDSQSCVKAHGTLKTIDRVLDKLTTLMGRLKLGRYVRLTLGRKTIQQSLRLLSSTKIIQRICQPHPTCSQPHQRQDRWGINSRLLVGHILRTYRNCGTMLATV